MTIDELFQAKKNYKEIVDGKVNGWLDPGEYEDLKQKWFDSFAEQLLDAVEMHNELALERGEYR